MASPRLSHTVPLSAPPQSLGLRDQEADASPRTTPWEDYGMLTLPRTTPGED